MTVRTIIDMLDAMTLEERVSLLSGEDNWSLPAVMRVEHVDDGADGHRLPPCPGEVKRPSLS